MTDEKKKGVFDDITLTWRGKEYKIEARRVMGAIRRIEEHVTLSEMLRAASEGNIKFGNVAAAYAALLNYAGARVTDEEVYSSMFDEGASERIFTAVDTLLQMMMPPNIRKRVNDEADKRMQEESEGAAEAAPEGNASA